MNKEEILKKILKPGAKLTARKLTKREMKKLLKKLEAIHEDAEKRKLALAKQDISKIIITI